MPHPLSFWFSVLYASIQRNVFTFQIPLISKVLSSLNLSFVGAKFSYMIFCLIVYYLILDFELIYNWSQIQGMYEPKLMRFFPHRRFTLLPCVIESTVIFDSWVHFCFQQHNLEQTAFLYMCSLLGIGWDNFSWFLCFLVSLKMPICM